VPNPLRPGNWPSQLSAEMVAAGSVRLGGVALDGDTVYWVESRPEQQGRLTLLRQRTQEMIEEILPAPFSVRTRVHEYGGGAFAVAAGVVVFANDADQRLYRLDTNLPGPWQATPITPAGPLRYADLQFDPPRQRLICVVERARPGREPENFIAGVSLATGAQDWLVGGGDFYAFPRLDPTGQRLAYLTWNHPTMPWEACELFQADVNADGLLAAPVKIAGGTHEGGGEAIFQPAWSPTAVLHFISDRNGFGNLYRLSDDGNAICLAAMEAEFSSPLWVFGLSTYAWLDDDTIVCALQKSGLWHLATLACTTGTVATVETHLTEFAMVHADHGRAVFIAGSAAEASALYAFDGHSRSLTPIHRPTTCPVAAADISHPRAMTFPTTGGATAYGLLYLPRSVDVSDSSSPADERPPLLVICHGGPTGSTSTALNLTVQFWTTRGFAVLDVNYRGSTGYGRAYRKALDGQWGVVDVADCVAGARRLAEQGMVDSKRMAIRGSSAGGFTVLCALAFHDVFAAGASYYGVSDLEALAQDTHKFESHYLESLVGPYPRDAELYRARSPIHAADRLSCPVIFFQGLQDRVVPPAQAETMVAALRARGLAAPLLLFADEQHGFRRCETIRACLEAELRFYQDVFA